MAVKAVLCSLYSMHLITHDIEVGPDFDRVSANCRSPLNAGLGSGPNRLLWFMHFLQTANYIYIYIYIYVLQVRGNFGTRTAFEVA